MRDAVVLCPAIGDRSDPGWIDRTITWLAERQHGVVARWQLLDIGIGRHAIYHRVERRRLHQVHRGVYAVGHRVLSADGRRMAAVLAGGPRAVLSHRDAAAAWGLRCASGSRSEVTLPFRRNPTAGIQAHCARLPTDEVTTVRGVRVTIVPRTILDLAGREPPRVTERLIHEADVLRLHDQLSLPDLLARYPRRPGTPTIRAILADRGFGAGVSRNVFEDAFDAFIDQSGLPRPERNVILTIGGRLHEIDRLWRRQRLAVELDGRAAHDTARAFEADRAKDRRLTVAGLRPLRITWRQLHGGRAQLAADLGVLL